MADGIGELCAAGCNQDQGVKALTHLVADCAAGKALLACFGRRPREGEISIRRGCSKRVLYLTRAVLIPRMGAAPATLAAL